MGFRFGGNIGKANLHVIPVLIDMHLKRQDNPHLRIAGHEGRSAFGVAKYKQSRGRKLELSFGRPRRMINLCK